MSVRLLSNNQSFIVHTVPSLWHRYAGPSDSGSETLDPSVSWASLFPRSKKGLDTDKDPAKKKE